MLSGCYVAYDPIYDTKRVWVTEYIYEDHPHTTEVYWYTDYELGGIPYFGYWEGWYYYYGVPHYYPWWHYYLFLPPYHYYANTHVHIHCDSGYYVYHGHRKNNRFNNKNGGEYKASISLKTKEIKTNTFPRDWKSSNSTRINKQNELKYNINKQNYNRTFNGNFNQSYNKHNNSININKNIKINKGNNGSKRSNKTNTSRKPK
jgi:hypothetical protein